MRDDRRDGLALQRRRWGADPDGDLWRFALWAPRAREVGVEVEGVLRAMARDEEGFWTLRAPARDGNAYLFVLDGEPLPDPAARVQAGMDPLGASRLHDPRGYPWAAPWAGRPWEEAAIYELHVGTFTPQGTFAAAARRMAGLAALGVTAVELMPVCHFPGTRGWGYDGALLMAPHPAYGTPDDLRRLVEAAQAEGVMIILDVVLNHFSPEGAAMHRVAPDFFHPTDKSPWGDRIDFARRPVRDFALDTCRLWLAEYRMDGLRLDAVHELKDDGDPELAVEIARMVRGLDLGRPLHLIAEDSRNVSYLREPDRDGGKLYDAAWNDDFHHSVHCLLTEDRHAFLASFAEDPLGDLKKALRDGQVEEGQPRPPRRDPRGEPAGHLPPTAFVNHNQNHDQIGNHPHGERLLAAAEPGGVMAAHALLLAAPYVPMLFMGEEVGETRPFHYFTDVSAELAGLIHQGRMGEFGHDDPGVFPYPNDPAAFRDSVPDLDADTEHARAWRELTRRGLAFRAAHVVPLLRSGRVAPGEVAERGERALTARWRFAGGTLVVHANLGAPGEAPAGPFHFAQGDIARDGFAVAARVEAA